MENKCDIEKCGKEATVVAEDDGKYCEDHADELGAKAELAANGD